MSSHKGLPRSSPNYSDYNKQQTWSQIITVINNSYLMLFCPTVTQQSVNNLTVAAWMCRETLLFTLLEAFVRVT